MMSMARFCIFEKIVLLIFADFLWSFFLWLLSLHKGLKAKETQ